MDSAAETLTELLLAAAPVRLVYHLENPVRQSWHDVLAILTSKLGIPKAGFVPLDDWLKRVETFVTDKGSQEDISAATMLTDFFRQDFQHMSGGNVILDTMETRRISKTLGDMDAVEGDLIASYVDHWRKMRFLT